MERHPTDFVELLFGLAFVLAGGAFIVHQATDRSFDAAWIAAIALVTVGAAFLAVTVLHRPGRPAVPEPGMRGPGMHEAIDTSRAYEAGMHEARTDEAGIHETPAPDEHGPWSD